jgi:hypothetical protein
MTRRIAHLAILLTAAWTAGMAFTTMSAAPVRPRAIPAQRRPIPHTNVAETHGAGRLPACDGGDLIVRH